jgi:hypothetical protein
LHGRHLNSANVDLNLIRLLRRPRDPRLLGLRRILVSGRSAEARSLWLAMAAVD